MMPIKFINKLRSKFNKAQFYLYLYDSIANIKGIRSKLHYFDRVFSFDLNDSKDNSNIIFRPLFFIDDFKQKGSENNVFEYDLTFIGTIHSDRYKIIMKLKNILSKNNFNYYFYCYLQSLLIYYYYFQLVFKKKK
jgi:hypothetical protein